MRYHLLMIGIMGLLVRSFLRRFRSRRWLLLENLVLRQQLATLKRRHRRARLGPGRQTFLGRRSPILVRMEASTHRCHSKDGSAMAPFRVPAISETDFKSSKGRWETTNTEGSS